MSIFSDFNFRNKKIKQIEIPLLEEEKIHRQSKVLSSEYMKIGDESLIVKKLRKTNLEILGNKLDKKLLPIDCDGEFLLVWNIINFLAIMYNFIEIPIITFIASKESTAQFNDLGFVILNVVIVWILFIDLIFVRGRISFYLQGRKVWSNTALIRRYLGSQFLLDVISLVVLIVYVATGDQTLIYLKILFYLKLFTLVDISGQIQQKLMLHKKSKALYKFLRMVLFIYFVTNLIACIYFAIDYHYYLEKGFYYQNGYLWLTGSGTVDNMNIIQSFPVWAWYIYALYWTIQTTAGVGYGNITPRNPVEVLYCNLTIIFVMVIFVFFADNVISIVLELQEETSQKQLKYSEFQQAIENFDVTNQTRNKVKDYISRVIEQYHTQTQEDFQQLLSHNLKKTYQTCFKGEFLNNIGILKQLSKHKSHWNQFSHNLLQEVQQVFYFTDNVFFKEYQTQNFNLYYIFDGKVRLKTSYTDETSEMMLGSWNYFGIRQFFFGGKAQCTAICVQFSKIYQIGDSHFMKILRKFRPIFEEYCQLRQRVQIGGESSDQFNVKCFNCSLDHLEAHCQFVQFSKVQRKHKIHPQSDQQRQPYNRKYKTSQKQRTISQKGYGLQLEYEVELDQVYQFD